MHSPTKNQHQTSMATNVFKPASLTVKFFHVPRVAPRIKLAKPGIFRFSTIQWLFLYRFHSRRMNLMSIRHIAANTHQLGLQVHRWILVVSFQRRHIYRQPSRLAETLWPMLKLVSEKKTSEFCCRFHWKNRCSQYLWLDSRSYKPSPLRNWYFDVLKLYFMQSMLHFHRYSKSNDRFYFRSILLTWCQIS